MPITFYFSGHLNISVLFISVENIPQKSMIDKEEWDSDDKRLEIPLEAQ